MLVKAVWVHILVDGVSRADHQVPSIEVCGAIERDLVELLIIVVVHGHGWGLIFQVGTGERARE